MPKVRVVKKENIPATEENLLIGRQFIPVYPVDKQFVFNLRSRLTKEEASICDSIWNLETKPDQTNEKIFIINSVAQRFNDIKQRPKSFFCYLLMNGPYKGIYKKWTDIAAQIENQKPLRSLWKGFDSFHECIKVTHEKVGFNYYLDPIFEKNQNFKDEDLDSNIGLPCDITNLTSSSSSQMPGNIITMVEDLDKQQLTIPNLNCFSFLKELVDLSDINFQTFLKLQEWLMIISRSPVQGFSVQLEEIPVPEKEKKRFFRTVQIDLSVASEQMFRDEKISFYDLFKYGLLCGLILSEMEQVEWLPARVKQAIKVIKRYDDDILVLDIFASPPKFWKSEPEPSCSAIKILTKSFSSDWDKDLLPHNPCWQFVTGQTVEDVKIWYYHVHFSDFFWNSEVLQSEEYSLFGETPTVKIYIPSAVSTYAFLNFFKVDNDADDEWILFYKNKKLKDLIKHAQS